MNRDIAANLAGAAGGLQGARAAHWQHVEVTRAIDWLPTLLAAAGTPDVKRQLLEGTAANGKTFKVHLDSAHGRGTGPLRTATAWLAKFPGSG